MSDALPPDLDVLLDGSILSSSVRVLAVEVEQAVGEVPTASVTLDAAGAGDARTFAPGRVLEVRAGYGGARERLFRGEVTARRGTYADGDGPTLTVVAADTAHRLAGPRRSRVFARRTDAEAAAEILADAGLVADVASTAVRHEALVQHDATDWAFLGARAAATGAVVVADGGTVRIRPPAAGSPVATVGPGDGLLALDLAVDARGARPGATATAWDPDAQAAVSADGSAPATPLPGDQTAAALEAALGADPAALRSSAALPVEELQAWADGHRLRTRLALAYGTARFVGAAHFRPDVTVELRGVGDLLKGPVYVSAVRHRIDGGEWVTDATLGLVAGAPLEASGLLPAARGLHIGTVRRVADDPAGAARVEVALPLDGDEAVVWARLAAPYASDGAGLAFRPEVGDEVVLGFLAGDPRHPVVLGSLHSAARQPPAAPDDANAVKTITTHGGLAVTFDDEAGALTLSTPGGARLALRDADGAVTLADANGNRIVLSAAGIEIASASDLTVRAEQAATVSGTTGVEVRADGGTASVRGVNATVEADAQASLASGAVARVEGGAMAQIDGAAVFVNGQPYRPPV